MLFIDPPKDLAKALGWRRVGARPRWNLIEDAWRPHDLSLQRPGQHRWWGTRDHVRIWRASDGSHAIAQAHREEWTTWPRRHRVRALDAARDLLAAPHAAARYVQVDSHGPGHDGRVLILQWPRGDAPRPRSG